MPSVRPRTPAHDTPGTPGPGAPHGRPAAVAANPNHAEAHFQLGMALVNEGDMAGAGVEFNTYLKLAPTGPNAATAKALADQIKK